MAWLGPVWPASFSSLPPSLLPPSLVQHRGHWPHCPLRGPVAHGLRMGGDPGGFWLQCTEPPPPHTAPKALKAIKQPRKNDSGRGNEPRRKLTHTQGAARLSADREGRLPHKTKHLNSPLYNNYRALNASPPVGVVKGRSWGSGEGMERVWWPAQGPLCVGAGQRAREC